MRLYESDAYLDQGGARSTIIYKYISRRCNLQVSLSIPSLIFGKLIPRGSAWDANKGGYSKVQGANIGTENGAPWV